MAAPASSPDVLLEQMVRVSSNQWDADGRLSTRTGLVITASGGILGSTVATLATARPEGLYIAIAGWAVLVLSIGLSGVALVSKGWSIPPALVPATVSASFSLPAVDVKKGLVMAYLQACTENATQLAESAFWANVGIVMLTVGVALLGVAFLVVRV